MTQDLDNPPTLETITYAACSRCGRRLNRNNQTETERGLCRKCLNTTQPLDGQLSFLPELDKDPNHE